MKIERPSLFDPQVYKLLMRIIWAIPPVSIEGLEIRDLADLVVDQIKEVGDKLGTPIVRSKYKFYIYEDGQPMLIYNRSLQHYLTWVATQLKIEEKIVYDLHFRTQMFGRCCRELAEEE